MPWRPTPCSRGEPRVGGGRRHGRPLPRRAGRSGRGTGSGPPDHRRRGGGRRPPLAAARRRGRAAAGGRSLGAHLAGAAPGAGRRGTRHLPPGPRSTHLEILPGQASESDLLAGTLEGLYLPEASRGALDPLSGEFALYLPYARRFRRGALAETVGPCVLRGRVADLLTRVVAVGAEAKPAGAGWCAKGGQKLPVWATAPALRLEDVEVTP